MSTENTPSATAFAAPVAGFYSASMFYPQPGEAPGLSMYSGRTVEITIAGIIDHLAMVNRDLHVMVSIVDPLNQRAVIDCAGTPAKVTQELQAFVATPPAAEVQPAADDFLTGVTACPISADEDCEACQ